MGQVTWRADDGLIERAKDVAAEQGRSLNDYLTSIVDAATDPDLAGGEAARVRERLARAGLLVDAGPTPPDEPLASDGEVERLRRVFGRDDGVSRALQDDRG